MTFGFSCSFIRLSFWEPSAPDAVVVNTGERMLNVRNKGLMVDSFCNPFNDMVSFHRLYAQGITQFLLWYPISGNCTRISSATAVTGASQGGIQV